MSRESLIIISRLIVAAVFITSILAMALGDFFITLITVSGGLIVWLLYLLAAGLGTVQGEGGTEITFGKTLSKVVAGLGSVLAVSAFVTYGVEQTMWGGYAFDLAGLALALAILWVTLMPLVILQLMSKPLRQAQGRPGAPAAPESERPAAAMPEQQLYYGGPYPQEPDAYEGDYIEYDEEGEEWEEEEEGDEDYYEDEESDEDEDEDEYEEDEEEDEDIR